MVCCRAVVHLDWGVVLGLWEDSLHETVSLISDQVEWADAPFAKFRAILQASGAVCCSLPAANLLCRTNEACCLHSLDLASAIA